MGPSQRPNRDKNLDNGPRGLDMELFRGLLSVFVLYIIAGTLLVLGFFASKALGDPLVPTDPAPHSRTVQTAAPLPSFTSF